MNDQEFKPARGWVQAFTLFAGVIMPAISITVEATTHICAETFFDPIPTTWHLILVVFVPLAQLHTWLAIRRGVPSRTLLIGLANALTVGVSVFYSIVYVPIMPLAALTIVIGLGFLPLAPLLSLIASIVMRVQLKRVAERSAQVGFATAGPGLLIGLAGTALLVGAIELPASLTRYGLYLASSPSAERRAEGIRFLHEWGSTDYLLRACYDRSGWATDLVGFLFSFRDPVTTSEARAIYYRVTGETFVNSLPPERMGSRLIPQDTIDFDADQGGTTVGSKLKGLSLSSSRFDTSADGDGGVAYTEWILNFRNDSEGQREARAEVQLPPGGVVSRLTLWVNNEEREAAFAGTSKVREAYQQVAIRQRRDPVLVTAVGRDRILVQCFPVPPQGEMKVRLGITAPLMLDETRQGKFLFPHFVSRNFRIGDDVSHSFWIKAKTPMMGSIKGVASVWEPTGSELYGRMPDAELSKPESAITISRGNVNEMWSTDTFGTKGFVIKQSIRERVPTHMNRIVMVVDTSAAMRDWVREIDEAVTSSLEDLDVKVVLTSIDGINESARIKLGDDSPKVLAALPRASFAGGADNVPALLHAWDLAASKPGNNAIVWVHGPQLLEMQPAEELRQRWERREYGPTLYSVQTTSGRDEIVKKLDDINEVKSVPRTGSLRSDLQALFGRLTGKIKTFEFVRSTKKLDPEVDLTDVFQTSDHLAGLWANDEVGRILAARDDSLNNAATTLAVSYQLVTPVSGAVVLETAQQYRDAGLQPVDAGTVPTIPEPEVVMLLAVVGLLLSWLIYHKHAGRRGRFPL